MKHSPKMMGGCAALLVLAIVLVAAGANVAYLALALPCMLMMGVMMWMMMGGDRGGPPK